jgi:RNA polymerase sigma-70 factor, ECF subfamily
MANEFLPSTQAAGAVAYVNAKRSGDASTVARRFGTNPFHSGADVSERSMHDACEAQTPTRNMSDESLVERIAQGDRAAMQPLFARHQLRVYRFVLRLTSNSATAEDVVSDVFIALWRNAARFQGRAQLSTWLLAIARNKAYAAMRRRVDRPLEHAVSETIPDPAITADETLDAGERSAVLRQCLERLSPAHREIIDLVYYHDKSVEEAAAIVGIPAATVKTRMFYARRRLGELVKAAGIETR